MAAIAPGRVRELRARFEASSSTPPCSPHEFELARAQIARHNLLHFAKHTNTPRPSPSITTPTPPTSRNKEEDEEEEGGTFWLSELDAALHKSDANSANLAVLVFFLQEFAPHRVHEAEEMLLLAAEDVQALFAQLAEEYAAPHHQQAYHVFVQQQPTTANTHDDDEDDDANWAKFDDEAVILTALRRPSGVWAVNYNPWE